MYGNPMTAAVDAAITTCTVAAARSSSRLRQVLKSSLQPAAAVHSGQSGHSCGHRMLQGYASLAQFHAYRADG